jgi:probable rRNA maturation factor
VSIPMATSIQVQIEEPFETSVSPDQLRAAAEATVETEGRHSGEMTVVVTGDEAVRTLNRTYLGIDASTDVLSFGGEPPDFVAPPSAGVYLGDIVISYPQAKNQASAAGHPVESEMVLLVVHGVLHLLGYDHVRPEDKALMWERQGAILSRLGLAHVQPS